MAILKAAYDVVFFVVVLGEGVVTVVVVVVVGWQSTTEVATAGAGGGVMVSGTEYVSRACGSLERAAEGWMRGEYESRMRCSLYCRVVAVRCEFVEEEAVAAFGLFFLDGEGSVVRVRLAVESSKGHMRTKGARGRSLWWAKKWVVRVDDHRRERTTDLGAHD